VVVPLIVSLRCAAAGPDYLVAQCAGQVLGRIRLGLDAITLGNRIRGEVNCLIEGRYKKRINASSSSILLRPHTPRSTRLTTASLSRTWPAVA
jgi:hypothetical protein